MGTIYSNIDSYDIYQTKPFIPIYFAPKIEEKKDKDSNKNSTCSNRKISSISSQSECRTRKSTLDDEEEKKIRKVMT